MNLWQSFIQQNIHRFQQPEAFLPFDNPSFGNPPFDQATYRVLIVRLSPFRDVDRSTPHLFLFQQVQRALPQAFIDLAFFPPQAERELFAQNDVPFLIGTQSMRALAAFDLALISNAYTLELINLPYLLLHSNAPLRASQRGVEWPLLLLGGSNALAAQAIIDRHGDSLVDGIFFGEGEGLVAELVGCLARRRKTEQRQTLADFATRNPGLWVTGAFSTVNKAVLQKPQAQFLLTQAPLLNSAEARTANLQIDYGCPAFCAFCFEGYDRKPYRELPYAGLIDAARQIKRAQGAATINLYSFNANAHRDILALIAGLDRLFERVSLKSQRIDLLRHIEPLLEAEVQTGKRSFTLGIEGISARQRLWLHKSLPNADISALLQRLFDLKVREIKLFYILTGHETDDDMAEFRAFLRTLKTMRRQARSTRVICSFGLLIRMPFTPLRYDRLILDEAEWKLLIGQAKSACETNGLEFRLAFDWAAYCVTQVLVLGGYWLIEPIVALAQAGYCFDATLPEAYWPKLQSLIQRAGRWNDALLGEKGPDYAFALDFVHSNIPAAFLYQQFRAAQSGVDDGYCLGATCLGCGACVDAAQRKAITKQRVRRPQGGAYLAQLKRTALDKRALKPLYLRVALKPALAGGKREWVEAMLFKGLLARYPAWIDRLLSVRESLFMVKPNNNKFLPTMIGGQTVFALKAWERESIRREIEATAPWEQAEFALLGLAPHFEPGVYTRLKLEMRLPTAHFGRPREHLERYLRGEHLPYSLRRQDGGYVFDIPKKGLKRKVLYSGHFELGQDEFRAALNVGVRFDLLAFLRTFGGAHNHYHAKIVVTEIDQDAPS